MSTCDGNKVLLLNATSAALNDQYPDAAGSPKHQEAIGAWNTCQSIFAKRKKSLKKDDAAAGEISRV